MKFDLTWGESKCVREAFVETFSGRPVVISYKELSDGFGYPKHEGNDELINITREVIKRQVGIDYPYILLTNGATGAVTIAMRAYRQAGANVLFTRSAPYFTVYPSMIEAAGFETHKTEGYSWKPGDSPVALLDSPTNPQGLILGPSRMWPHPIIWDAVYHNKVYGSGLGDGIGHDVICGSYSKLLGINGIRVGWIATHDPLLYERMRSLVTAEYCGLSHASTLVLLDILGDQFRPFYWDNFESNARFKLDFNRGEWAKLERYFEGHPVAPVGMFYYARMDGACKKLIAKAGIEWMPGSKLGHDDDFGRFNLGQDNKTILQAVKAVLKADKIK